MTWAPPPSLAAADAAATAGHLRIRIEWVGMPEGTAALVALVVAAAIIVFVATLYRRERPVHDGRLRWACCGLRVLCLAAAALILLEPSVAHDAERLLPGRVLILADRSASMSIRDAQLPDELKAEWAAALALEAAEPLAELTRHEMLRGLLQASGVLTAGDRQNQVELATFAEEVQPVLELAPGSPQEMGTDGPAGASAPLPPWSPTGLRTDLVGALDWAIAQPDPDRTAGIMVLTDGRDTEGGDLSAAVVDAASLGVPLHFVGLGSPERPRNVAIAELAAGARALKGLPLDVRAFIRSQGYEGRSVSVTLTATDRQTDEQRQVLERSVELSADGILQQVDLSHVPEAAGSFIYTARAEPLDGEPRTDDNSAVAEVTVADEKTRVLVLAGGPSREYRFLRWLIERDPAFEATVRLHGATGAEGVVPLPRQQEELLAYDVVLACDPAPADFSADWIGTLADMVDSQGLGVVFLAGPTHTPELMADPALGRLRDLLPVLVDAAANRTLIGGAGYATQPRAVALDDAATGHPLVSPGDGPGGTAFWRSLPGLYWCLPIRAAKAGATVLLRCGGQRTGIGPEEGMPLAAVHSYGLGRVFYCGSPETWRWRRQGIGHYDRFWLRVLRHCASGRPTGLEKRGRIELDRSVYEIGQAVRIRARLLDAGFRPLQAEAVELSAGWDAGGEESVRLRPSPATPGEYEGVFYPAQFGRFELAYTTSDGLRITESFEVRQPNVEFDDPRMASPVMQRLARMTGGRWVRPSEFGQFVRGLPDRSRTVVEPGPLDPLWDTPYLLALLVAALGAEWALRKRMGLL